MYKTITKDNRISFTGIGIFVYILNVMKRQSTCFMKQIIDNDPSSVSAIPAAIEKLEECGYISTFTEDIFQDNYVISINPNGDNENEYK